MSATEKGSLAGMRLLAWLALSVGRWPTRLIVRAVALWYTLLHPGVRRASASWWRKILHREPTLREIYQHVLRFAQTALDRIFLLKGRVDLFEFTHTGHENMAQLRAQNRGAILLSAHLGSPSAMSAEGGDQRLRIHIVGYFKNAKMINAIMANVNPQSQTRVVHIEPGSTASVLLMRDRIEAGDMLALAADRIGIGDRTAQVDFLGEKAAFPTGPFLLASVLKCPVLLVFGLYREPNHYDLYCEPFADRIDLPRKNREEAMRDWLQKYAQRLEYYARKAPDNWFNFFDFWHKP